MTSVPNPFSNGKYERGGFTYKESPGDKLFYITGERGHWIPLSVLVFAKDENDAKNKLFDALRYRIRIRLAETKELKKTKSRHWEDFVDSRNGQVKTMQEILQEHPSWNVEITEIKRNQFFKTAWADNDDIF